MDPALPPRDLLQTKPPLNEEMLQPKSPYTILRFIDGSRDGNKIKRKLILKNWQEILNRGLNRSLTVTDF